MASSINIRKLSEELRAHRGNRPLREIAGEISTKIGKVSASTLSRIEQGKIPDLDTFVKVCKWLGVDTDRFLDSSSRLPTNTPEVIEAHLRADKILNPETISALSEMIRLAYSDAKGRASMEK